MGILTALGQEIRRTVEPPAEVLRLVKAKHQNFGLRFSPFTGWAITWAWDEKDPRWLHVREGRRPPANAHDVVCDLPADCPIESAGSYIDAHCQINPDSKAWEGVAKAVERSNRIRAMAIEEAALADVHNRIELSARNGTLRPLFDEGSEELDDARDIERVEVSPDELRAIARGEA